MLHLRTHCPRALSASRSLQSDLMKLQARRRPSEKTKVVVEAEPGNAVCRWLHSTVALAPSFAKYFHHVKNQYVTTDRKQRKSRYGESATSATAVVSNRIEHHNIFRAHRNMKFCSFFGLRYLAGVRYALTRLIFFCSRFTWFKFAYYCRKFGRFFASP